MPDPIALHPAEVRVVGPSGSLVVFNGYLWARRHAEYDRSASSRHLPSVARIDQERQNDQRALLQPDTAERLSAAARRVLDASRRDRP